ncbi:MAG: hypothetical protein EOP49_12085 [Sphingobacteriales bacterium]|nr:MAG: hypothetical protein EOP49_12085 [Sphingobacteriales bacterium]
MVPNTALNFFINDASDLEVDQIIQNALTLRVASKVKTSIISARLQNFTYPPGFIAPSTVLSLDWISDNSNKDYNLITGPIALTNMDQMLFNQKKMPGSVDYFSYYYNLILTAPGYNYVPGTYSFTIQFTMTQP